MSSRINLNDDISDVFQFTIGGLDYDLKYPTLEELEPITEITKKKEKIADKKCDTPEETEARDKEVAELDKRTEEIFYGLIVPVGHETPIKDTLKKQPYPVVRAFNKMISTQLSAE